MPFIPARRVARPAGTGRASIATPRRPCLLPAAKADKIDRVEVNAGGKPIQCGWLEDKFGVSWQVVPTRLTELMVDPDPAKAGRVTEAMLKMIKLDVPTLEKAARAA